VVSPRVIVDSYFGYTRLDTSQEPVSLSKGNLGQLIQSAGTNGPDPGTRDILPQHHQLHGLWKISGLAGLLLDPAYDYVANASWVERESHHQIWRRHERSTTTTGSSRQRRVISPLPVGRTTLNGAVHQSVQQLFHFPARYTTGATHNFLQEEPARPAHVGDSLYLRDQWQVSRVLTVSLGVRWDYSPFGTGAIADSRLFTFKPTPCIFADWGKRQRIAA